MLSIIINSLILSLKYTIKLSIIVLIIMFIVDVFINLGGLKFLEKIFSPILKRLDINPLLISSILACFLSPTVGYSILSELYKDKQISEKEVIATSLANSFPSVFAHTFTFFVPIVIPLLGFVGIIFILIRLGVAFIKTCIGLFLLNIFSSKKEIKIIQNQEVNKKKTFKSSFKRIIKFAKRLVPTMFFMLFLVSILSKIGFFDYLTKIFYPITSLLNLNPNVITIVFTEIINVQSAIILSSALLNEGLISGKDVLIGLILGNVLTFSSRYIKHSLPLQVSLFGKLGFKIVMINAIITLILDIIIIAMLIFLRI